MIDDAIDWPGRFRSLADGFELAARQSLTAADRMGGMITSPVYGETWTRSEKAELYVSAQSLRDQSRELYSLTEQLRRQADDQDAADEETRWQAIRPKLFEVLDRQMAELLDDEGGGGR